MKVLVAPLELKGTLSAAEAADAILEGLVEGGSSDVIDTVPLSDGGPGFTQSLRTPRCLERTVRVRDPLGRKTEATWLQDHQTALIEMAAASGLSRLSRDERDPTLASTFGTGELIRSALDLGCTRIIVGAGGSATNDGGVGAAQALGVRFVDEEGRPLPPGGVALDALRRIDLSGRDPRLTSVSIEVATDVRNPLLGPLGASRVYGPQKGAEPATVEALERGLSRLDAVVREQLGVASAGEPRMGAAGGLAYGLAVFCGARVRGGFELAAAELNLTRRIRDADLVITAEGQLDAQSEFGKGPFQIALASEALGKPCIAFVGRLGPGAPLECFARVIEVSPGLPMNAPDVRPLARAALRIAVRTWARARPDPRPR